MSNEITNNEQNEELMDFLEYCKLLCAHIQLIENRFKLWTDFYIANHLNPGIVSQCHTFVQEFNYICLENILLGLMRVYEKSNGKKEKSNGKDENRYSLFYLSEPLEKFSDSTPVTTVELYIHRRQKGLILQNDYDESVIKYINGHKTWKTNIISSDNAGVKICLNCKDCSSFITGLANMIRNKYNDIFILRNKFLAHNDFEFGKKAAEEYPISARLYDFCDACLDVCEYCIGIIGRVFVADKIVLFRREQQYDSSDIGRLFGMASAYLNMLPIINESDIICSKCGCTYKQTMRQQNKYEISYLSYDICPYCGMINNNPQGFISYINVPIESPIEIIKKANQSLVHQT